MLNDYKFKRIVSQIFFTVLLLFGCGQTGPNGSLTDSVAKTYAEWIEAELAEKYDVAGGEWMLAKDEGSTLESFTSFSLQSQLVTADTVPFAQAMKLESESALALPWHSGTRANMRVALNEGDRVLVTFWVRALASEADRGVVLVSLQDNSTYEDTVSELIPVTEEWRQFYLRGEVPHSSTAGGAMLFFATGGQQQTIEIGGIAAFNFGQTQVLPDLPQTVHNGYVGEENDAAWRSVAQQRIDEHRKTDIQIEVLDENGDPVDGAQIVLAMQEHAFAFGTAINANLLAEESNRAEIYRGKLLNLDGRGRGFNAAVLENGLKWPRWESSDTSFRENAVAAIDWLLAHGIRVRGHNLIWPGWSHMPSDLEEKQNDADYLLTRTNERIRAMVSEPTLQGKIYEWDVLNELRTNNDIANFLAEKDDFESGEEVYAQWYELAHQADPQMKLFVNDYGQLDNGALLVGQHNHYKYFIQTLIDNGDHLGGIGLQGHLDYPLAGPERIYAMLNDFAKYDKDIVITEYDLAVAYRNEPDLGEAVAGRYTRDFLTTIFSHPSVDGFIMWGFWDELHWLDDSPMFRADWSLKPAGEAFIELVFNEWWTNELGRTNADGLFATRGFLGQYRVTANVDGTIKSIDVEVTKESGKISVAFDGTETTYTTNLPLIARVE